MAAALAALGSIAAIAVCGAELPVAEAESVGMSTARLQRIDVAMQSRSTAPRLPPRPT